MTMADVYFRGGMWNSRRLGVSVMAAIALLPCAQRITAQELTPLHELPIPPIANPSAVQAAWVEIGDQNQAIARVITTDSACPLIHINGKPAGMKLRAAAATVPQRTTASAPADSKPSEFPVTVCETALPASTKVASVGSHLLRLPETNPRRIVIIGDTGCRLKKADNAYQACNNPDQYPFAKVAAAAAAMHPDLVLHVGDYQYRENVCPDDIAGCKGSPWGYGWDTWNADLFKPGGPLLAAAPWIVVRGNHEECARAGQGWFRFLDTQPYEAERSCDDPASDNNANYSDPYAVSLGRDTQVVVFDSSKTGKKALATTNAQFVTYQQQFLKVEALASKAGTTTLFTNHHPILGFSVDANQAAPGNLALQSVLNALNGTAYYPKGIQLALHGHVHDFQAINFSSGQPPTIVAGIAGDTLENNLPDPFPENAQPAPGVSVQAISQATAYGFLVMERGDAGWEHSRAGREYHHADWKFTAYTVDGSVMATCTFAAGALSCDKTGYVGP